MDVVAYYTSLARELEAVRDRVRNFIGHAHGLTDGEWKESVLRSVLRQHLPGTAVVGRGFVVRPNQQSRQIDVLVYGLSTPILHRDGDLVFVAPDGVRAIVEVKSRIAAGEFGDVAGRLADNAAFVAGGTVRQPSHRLFAGLFTYETEIGGTASILASLRDAARGDEARVITHVACGNSCFVRFWWDCPHTSTDHLVGRTYRKWHGYSVQDRAPGYFVGNLVQAVAADSADFQEDLWFPSEGKERDKDAELGLDA